MRMLEKVKKQKPPQTLATEMLREYRKKFRISLAFNAFLIVALIFTILF